MKPVLLLSLCSLAVANCTSFEPLRPDLAARSVPSRLDEIAYINGLRAAYDYTAQDQKCYTGEELKHFRGSLEQGLPNHTVEQETGAKDQCVKFRDLPIEGSGLSAEQSIQRYLDSGYGLTDLYCQRFFVIAVESDRKRQFQRDMGGTADALVNAVFAAAGVGPIATQVSNALFEGYDGTYQNIQDAFMVSPDLALVRKLVHNAQRDFKAEILKSPPTSYEAARQVIERYAGTCSYTGMKQMVNDSVAAQTKALGAAADAKGIVPQIPPPAAAETSPEAAVTSPLPAPAAAPRTAPPATQPEAAVTSPVTNPPK